MLAGHVITDMWVRLQRERGGNEQGRQKTKTKIGFGTHSYSDPRSSPWTAFPKISCTGSVLAADAAVAMAAVPAGVAGHLISPPPLLPSLAFSKVR